MLEIQIGQHSPSPYFSEDTQLMRYFKQCKVPSPTFHNCEFRLPCLFNLNKGLNLQCRENKKRKKGNWEQESNMQEDSQSPNTSSPEQFKESEGR